MDNYDRYLADIWIPTSSDYVYLNNLLLEQGQAPLLLFTIIWFNSVGPKVPEFFETNYVKIL